MQVHVLMQSVFMFNAKPLYIAHLFFWLLLLALTGCQSISEIEYKDFKPMAKEQRVMQSVKLSWDVRPDASQYCAQIAGSKGMFSVSPIACAVWSEKAQTCTIVTSPNPNHVVIGHEVRHCFEGHFHR